MEKRNNCEEEINLKPPDRTGNIDWCKCGCDCKLKATFAESFHLLFRLKSRTVRGASCHSTLMVNCLTVSHTC